MRIDNPIKVVSFLRTASKRTQAVFLSRMEDILVNDPRQDAIRKLFLDCINDFTRNVVKSLIGDVEDLVK